MVYLEVLKSNNWEGHLSFFWPIWVLFHRHWQFAGQRVTTGDHLYCSPSLSTTHKYSETYVQFWICDDNLVFQIAIDVIIRLLPEEICLPLGYSIWLNVNYILLVEFLSDLTKLFLIAMDWNIHDLSIKYYKSTANQVRYLS